jgi:Holliday junction resolvase RusA-like endonuclease
MTIHFHIPGQPVGKGRPRIGKVGAHARMFTPAKTVSYESTVALFAAQAMAGRPLLTGPVNLQMRVDFAIPTISDAMECVQDGQPFMCHEGVRDGAEPVHVCRGWAQAVRLERAA